MISQKQIIKKITKAAKKAGLKFVYARRGGNHDVYDLDGLMIPIQRHDHDKWTELRIYRQCEPKLGKGWWR